jgi:hypothetical protein
MNTKINNEYFNIIPFYFIHISKNMGMNIIASLPYNYTNQYFGIGYTKKNKQTLPTIYNLFNFTKRQYEFIKTNKNDNIILLEFKDRDKIYNTFKKFNVFINVSEKKNNRLSFKIYK